MITLILFSVGVLASPLTQALQVGDCDSALQLSSSAATPAQQLSLANCELIQRQPAKAISRLLPLESSTTLGPYARYLHAEAAYQSKDYETAANKLDSSFPFSEQTLRKVALLRGKSLIQGGDPIAGRDAIRPLLNTPISKQGFIPDPMEADPAEARWWLAEGARLRGKPEAGINVLYRIWTDNPTSEYSNKAASRLIAMGERLPDSTTETGRNHMMRRASSFRKLQHHPEALALLDMLPLGSPNTSTKKMAYATFRAKNYPRSVDLFSELKSPTGEDLYHLAVGHSRTDNYPLAAVAYEQIFNKFPDHKRADIASFKLGYLKYDSTDYSGAIPLFQAHLKRMPNTGMKESTLWFIGWSFYKLGQREKAETAFKKLTQQSPASDMAAAAEFWQGVIAEESGLTEDATGHYQAVLKRWPISGHAWHAANKLGIQFPNKGLVEVPTPPPGLNTPAFQLGMALAEAGLDAWARDQLHPLIPVAKQTKSGTLVMAHALIKAGDYTKAKSLARPYCVKPWTLVSDPLAQQACYPQPHGQALRNQIGSHPLPIQLPFAIMTAESGLKPWVSSPVGARGLMQLMPEVARGLHADKYPSAVFNADQLFQAGYNASLGTAELMRLYSALGTQAVDMPLPLAVAGYNGGEEAVLRWMSDYTTPIGAERFSEDVGYTETRRYVRRVLGYLMSYRYVYGDRPESNSTDNMIQK